MIGAPQDSPVLGTALFLTTSRAFRILDLRQIQHLADARKRLLHKRKRPTVIAAVSLFPQRRARGIETPKRARGRRP